MKLKTLLKVFFIINILTLIISCSVINKIAGSDGEIAKTNGTIIINGKKADKDAKVKPGDIIETENIDGSYADIIFPGEHKNLSFLHENNEIFISAIFEGKSIFYSLNNFEKSSP